MIKITFGRYLNNDLPARLMTFNGGEPHVYLGPGMHLSECDLSRVEIQARITNFNDLGELLVTTDALKRAGATCIELKIPYFPGARQDRSQDGEALTAKVYADIINAQGYESVCVYDPHSDVTPALLNNCATVEQYAIANKCLDRAKQDILGCKEFDAIIAPDAGAQKKAAKVASALRLPLYVATKTRDTSTGQLGAPVMYCESLPERVLIVDDICDGGGTFAQLAPVLKAKGAKSVSLYVTHGIFSKGLAPLAEHFDHIFTTNSFLTSAQIRTMEVDAGKVCYVTVYKVLPEGTP